MKCYNAEVPLKSTMETLKFSIWRNVLILKKFSVCVYIIYVHFRQHIKYFVIASVVADVQLLHSGLKSWLGHECMFTFLYIASLCIVVLYLHEL